MLRLSDSIRSARSKASRGQRSRGVALLMVLVLIALITTVVAEFQYNTRVDLQLAFNARDELQAEYNALSALRFRALILRHARKLNAVLSSLGQGLGLPTESLATMLPQVLESLPVECGLMSAITKPVDATGDEDEQLLPGECMATSVTEHAKIPIHLLASTRDAANVATILMGVLTDPKFERHFQEDDRNGSHAESPEVLIEAMTDWIDSNDTQELNRIGDENNHYDMLRNRYEVKNASFDSAAELQMVHGIDDELYDLLRDSITIYPDSPQIELPTAPVDRIVLWGLPGTLNEGVIIEQLFGHPGFPMFLQTLVEMKQLGTSGFGGLSLTVLKSLIGQFGLTDVINTNTLGKVFTDKGQTTWYTINAEGQVGTTKRKMHMVFQALEAQFYYARIE